MSSVTPRAARLTAWIGIPVALVASGVVVSTASYSAFSAETVNPTSNWSAGSVALSDDDNGSALFTATGLKPGSEGSKCIAVTSTGSLASTVKLYGTNPVTTKDLASNISIIIEQGTGGGSGSCSGFTAAATPAYTGTLAGFGSAATGFSTGVGSWAPTGTASDTKVYKVSYAVPSTAPSTVMGGTASIGLTWEAQNS